MAQKGSTRATSSSRHKLRAGKHNMAKGALRPEDAAVCVGFFLRMWGMGLLIGRLVYLIGCEIESDVG